MVAECHLYREDIQIVKVVIAGRIAIVNEEDT